MKEEGRNSYLGDVYPVGLKLKLYELIFLDLFSLVDRLMYMMDSFQYYEIIHCCHGLGFPLD